jgi:hypothetical protein
MVVCGQRHSRNLAGSILLAVEVKSDALAFLHDGGNVVPLTCRESLEAAKVI